MKRVLTFILLAFWTSPTSAQQAIANKPPKALGTVKAIRYEYILVNFSRDKTRIAEHLPNGRTLVWSFTPAGKVLTSEVFEHDGRASGTRALYNYDPTGRLTSIVHYLLGSLSFTETFAYPSARRVKITRVFEFNKDSNDIEIDEYDGKGNVTKATFYNGDGTLDETEFYKYDAKGNPTQFASYDAAGKLVFKETYEYEFDSHGNWTTERDKSWSADLGLGIEPKSIITRKITYY